MIFKPPVAQTGSLSLSWIFDQTKGRKKHGSCVLFLVPCRGLILEREHPVIRVGADAITGRVPTDWGPPVTAETKKKKKRPRWLEKIATRRPERGQRRRGRREPYNARTRARQACLLHIRFRIWRIFLPFPLPCMSPLPNQPHISSSQVRHSPCARTFYYSTKRVTSPHTKTVRTWWGLSITTGRFL